MREHKCRGKTEAGEWVYGSLVEIESGTYIMGKDGQFNDSPDYSTVGMGCGLEDAGITDRYEAMEYGWECAIKACFEGSPAFTEVIPESVGQFTGLKDMAGVDIYEGDLLNVMYTSNNGEHVHDCIYLVDILTIDGLVFSFKKLLWESAGYNQFPICSTLSCKRDEIGIWYESKGNGELIVFDSWGTNGVSTKRWKRNDKSNYIKIVGSIHDTPDILT